MPYANETMSERRSHLRAVKKAQDPCACGRPKDCTSTQCRKCYDAQRRPRSETSDAFIECPRCEGRMMAGRAMCTKCQRAQHTGSKTASTGRKSQIEAFMAGPLSAGVRGDSIVNCYYWKQRRINILATTATRAKDHVRDFYGGDRSEVVTSVCSIKEININLTEIDLSQYNGAIP
jgi:hypothetical protein